MSDQDVRAQGRRRLNRCGFWIHRLRFINGCCGIRFMSRRCRDRGGSMNRSVCRVMVGVAGLAVLGMTATLAGAQTDEVKEKPPCTQTNLVEFEKMTWVEVKCEIAAGKTTALIYTGGVEERSPQNANGGHNLIAHATVEAIARELGNA